MRKMSRFARPPKIAASGCLMSAFLGISSLIIMFAGTMTASAGIGPLVVWGFVYDETGKPLEGAYVVVDLLDKDTNAVKRSLTGLPYPTGPSGGYTATFDPGDYVLGDKVRCTATYNSNQVTNQTVILDEDAKQIDLSFQTAIPQFGSAFGLAIAAVAVCVVGIIFVSLRRKP